MEAEVIGVSLGLASLGLCVVPVLCGFSWAGWVWKSIWVLLVLVFGVFVRAYLDRVSVFGAPVHVCCGLTLLLLPFTCSRLGRVALARTLVGVLAIGMLYTDLSLRLHHANHEADLVMGPQRLDRRFWSYDYRSRICLRGDDPGSSVCSERTARPRVVDSGLGPLVSWMYRLET